jgi:hypothetical protein
VKQRAGVFAAVGIAALVATGADAAQGVRSGAKVAAPTHASIAEAARGQDWAAVQAMARQSGGELNGSRPDRTGPGVVGTAASASQTIATVAMYPFGRRRTAGIGKCPIGTHNKIGGTIEIQLSQG